MIGSALTMRSPSTTIRRRRTPCVAGCWGPMLSTMSAVARPPAPRPTVSSCWPGSPLVVVTRSVCRIPRFAHLLAGVGEMWTGCSLSGFRQSLLAEVGDVGLEGLQERGEPELEGVVGAALGVALRGQGH